MDLDSAVSRVPSSDYLFVLIDANARTGVRIGEEDCKVLAVCGRETRVVDTNGTSLLQFSGDNKLALVNTVFSVPKGCTSRGDNKLALVSTFFSVLKGCTSRGDNKLALVNTVFYALKECTSRTFSGTWREDRKGLDYINTRQPHRKLVRNVTVHLQPCTDSDHNIVCATVQLPADSLVIENSEPPQGARVLTDEQSCLTPTDAKGWYNL